jgi:hypothetical protein
MKKSQNNLSKNEKILVSLYECKKNGKSKVRYEEIVANVFEKYPHDFHLKGYPHYPDAGDLIHKPLYNYKKKGYLDAVNKVFSLNERGVEYAKQLLGKGSSDNSYNRLTRSTSSELLRVKSSEGFLIFSKGEGDKLSENDFYNYLGVTVRTPKNSFIGRLETMNTVMAELKKHTDDLLYTSIINYHEFIMKKYKSIVLYFTKK